MTTSRLLRRTVTCAVLAGSVLLTGCTSTDADDAASSAGAPEAFPTPEVTDGEVPEDAFADERAPEEEFTDEDFPTSTPTARAKPDETPTPTPEATPEPTPRTPEPGPTPAPIAPAPAPVVRAPEPVHINAAHPSGAPLQMVNVKHGQHPTYERVAFLLSGTGTPGWHAHYMDRPVHQGSLQPVTIAGTYVMRFTLFGVANPAPGTNPYVGPPVIRSQHNSPIVEIQRGVLANGKQEWWIGFRSKPTFTVRRFPSAPVVYLDVPR